jgi:HNH endonuclease
VLLYEPDTGELNWKVTIPPKIQRGSETGIIDVDGYRQISIDGRTYRAHRLAWLAVHGQWPNGQLNHINRNRSDCRIVNLREATSSSNNANRGMYQDTVSGFKGVSWHKRTNKYQTRIGF